MASKTAPRVQDRNGTNAPKTTSLRTSETLQERAVDVTRQKPQPLKVDFRQLQARFG